LQFVTRIQNEDKQEIPNKFFEDEISFIHLGIHVTYENCIQEKKIKAYKIKEIVYYSS